MKRFYIYLFLFLIFIIGIYYGINSGEKIIKINKKDLLGEYILKFNKNSYYKLILNNDDNLTLIKGYKHKIILKKHGTWNIIYINNNESINTKISNLNSVDFSLGEINKNLFTGQIKIEAFSMGDFLGKEDDAFFLKI